MASKYKITGFARLLIFLIFLTPIAYIGASYYNGEDGIGKIKELIGMEDDKPNSVENQENLTSEEIILRQEKEIEALRSLNRKLKRDLANCKN